MERMNQPPRIGVMTDPSAMAIDIRRMAVAASGVKMRFIQRWYAERARMTTGGETQWKGESR